MADSDSSDDEWHDELERMLRFEGGTALHIACLKGELCSVKLLLAEDSVDINARTHRGDLSTPIYIACEHGHVEIVKLLLAHDGIDVNPTIRYTGDITSFNFDMAAYYTKWLRDIGDAQDSFRSQCEAGGHAACDCFTYNCTGEIPPAAPWYNHGYHGGSSVRHPNSTVYVRSLSFCLLLPLHLFLFAPNFLKIDYKTPSRLE